MKHTHYNQSGEVKIYTMPRMVYMAGEQQRPEPPPAGEIAPGNSPEAPQPVRDAIQALTLKWMNLKPIVTENSSKGSPNPHTAEYKAAMEKLRKEGEELISKAKAISDPNKAVPPQELDLIKNLLSFAPKSPTSGPFIKDSDLPGPFVKDSDLPGPFVKDSDLPGPFVTDKKPSLPAEYISPAEMAAEDLKDVIITPGDVAATALLKKTNELMKTSLKGKVTPQGFENYIRDEYGISADILASSEAGHYGTLTYADLNTYNGIISSPQRTVEAIKVLQQGLGQKPNGVFGPATYETLLKRHPQAASMLRSETPLPAPLSAPKLKGTEETPPPIPQS